MKKLMMLAVAVLASFIAMGDTWTDPETGIKWSYKVGGGEASVTDANPASGDIAIPLYLGGCPVTSIGSYAFPSCSGLTNVTIPSSVTNILDHAFSRCSGIKTFVVDNQNPNYQSVDGLLLTKDGTKLIAGVNGQVTIPSSVASIGEYAFFRCGGLTSVTIPSSVTSVGYEAFYGCSGLTSFVVDSQNPNYQSVDGLLLSKNGKDLIAGVNGQVTIPDGVTSIGSSAFSYYSGLTSVTIPSSVRSISTYAFNGCSGLTAFVVDSQNSYYQSVDRLLLTKNGKNLIAGANGDVVIPAGVTNICWYSFTGYSGMTSVTIPEGVTSIGAWAFRGCSGLKSVTIPEGVTSIGVHAFMGCSGLTSLTIPSSVKSIDYGVFWGCKSLTSVAIPEGVTSIGKYAFYQCYGLTSVTISSSVTNIGDSAFSSCRVNAVDFAGTPPNNVKNAYISKTAAIRYNVAYEDEWLSVIKECGFTNATPYVPGSLPDGGPYTETVDGIEWTFMVTNGESSVGTDSSSGRAIPWSTTGAILIPSTLGDCPVTSIGEDAFWGRSGLTAVTIPEGVTSIGYRAFFRCSGLESVTIPSSVTSIGDRTFSGCSGLKAFVVDSQNPNYQSSDGLLLTKDGPKLIAGVTGDVVIPLSVTSIGESAFAECSGLTGVTIPNSVTNICDYAFYYCSGLKSVTIPSSVTSIVRGGILRL